MSFLACTCMCFVRTIVYFFINILFLLTWYSNECLITSQNSFVNNGMDANTYVLKVIKESSFVSLSH